MDIRHIEQRLTAFLVGACLALAASVGTVVVQGHLFDDVQPVQAAAPADTTAR